MTPPIAIIRVCMVTITILAALTGSPAMAGAVQPEVAPATASPEAAPLLAKLEAAMAAIETGGYRVRMSTEMGDIRS